MYATSPLAAVIFDCDGVLVNTEPLHYRAFQAVLEPIGLGFDYGRYMEHYIGFDDRDAFMEAFREAGRSIDPPYLASLILAKSQELERIASRGIPTFPGVLELVRELVARRIPLAVASGALRSEVESFTKALGIREAFRVIVGADDVSRSKPDPETYRLALSRLKEHQGWTELDARRCVAIEDTPAGIRSAKAAGMCVVAVAHSYPVSQLTEADKVFENLAQLSVEGLCPLVQPTK